MVKRLILTRDSLRRLSIAAAAGLFGCLTLSAPGCSMLPGGKGKSRPAASASVAAASPNAAPTVAAASASAVPAVVAAPAAQATPAAQAAQPDALVARHYDGPHQTVAHIVASVDGEPITAHDVEQFSAAVGRPVSTNDLANNEDAKAALKALISQKLLEKEIQQYSSKIDEEQVDNYMEVVRRDKHLSPEQFKAALAQSGMSMDDFRKHAREELEKEMMLRQQVRQRVDISDADIKAYYDAHQADFTVATEKLKIAQILIGVPQNATPQQVALLQTKAEKIRKEAAAGADFGDLARKYSDDVSKNNGGELGWFGPNDIMDAVYNAVKNLKPGDVSQVVKTSHGFHVLKLEDHQVPGVRPLDQVKPDIRNALINERANSQLQNWIETDLVKQHDVETFY